MEEESRERENMLERLHEGSGTVPYVPPARTVCLAAFQKNPKKNLLVSLRRCDGDAAAPKSDRRAQVNARPTKY